MNGAEKALTSVSEKSSAHLQDRIDDLIINAEALARQACHLEASYRARFLGEHDPEAMPTEPSEKAQPCVFEQVRALEDTLSRVRTHLDALGNHI